MSADPSTVERVVLSGLAEAGLITRYAIRQEALRFAIQHHPGGSTSEVIEAAGKFYDFLLDIAGAAQIAYAEELAGE